MSENDAQCNSDAVGVGSYECLLMPLTHCYPYCYRYPDVCDVEVWSSYNVMVLSYRFCCVRRVPCLFLLPFLLVRLGCATSR